ncbi:hypothetical protein [Facklamia hominis]
MNKEKVIAFLKNQREMRLIGLDPEYESDYDKWQREQAETYQQIIDWIEKEEK